MQTMLKRSSNIINSMLLTGRRKYYDFADDSNEWEKIFVAHIPPESILNSWHFPSLYSGIYWNAFQSGY